METHTPPIYGQSASDHPKAQGSHFDPILESPLSPPLIDQRPTYDDPRETHLPPQDDSWITGLGLSISGTCGQPNNVYHTGCVVCGKDYPSFKEEITLGDLERTHVAGESYETRLAKKRIRSRNEGGILHSSPQGSVGGCRLRWPVISDYPWK